MMIFFGPFCKTFCAAAWALTTAAALSVDHTPLRFDPPDQRPGPLWGPRAENRGCPAIRPLDNPGKPPSPSSHPSSPPHRPHSEPRLGGGRVGTGWVASVSNPQACRPHPSLRGSPRRPVGKAPPAARFHNPRRRSLRRRAAPVLDGRQTPPQHRCRALNPRPLPKVNRGARCGCHSWFIATIDAPPPTRALSAVPLGTPNPRNPQLHKGFQRAIFFPTEPTRAAILWVCPQTRKWIRDICVF